MNNRSGIDMTGSESSSPQPNHDTTLEARNGPLCNENNETGIWESTSVTMFRAFLTRQYKKYELLLLTGPAIGLAKAYPPLGAVYLAPDITASWISTILIFFSIGLSLRLEELSAAAQRVYFNVFVQLFNFGFVSAVMFSLTRLLSSLGGDGILDQSLIEGLVICGSLPVTTSTLTILTRAAKGNSEAAALHSAFGNLVGVVLSPLLIFGYTGVRGNVNLPNVFYKLAVKIVLPMVVGQVLIKVSSRFAKFVEDHKPWLSKVSVYTFVFIMYTLFCQTFDKESNTSVTKIFTMVGFIILMSTFFVIVAWFSLKLLFRDDPQLRVAGLFVCVQKSSATGVPLIQTIYDGHPDIALYALPVTVWTTFHLLLSSFLVPRLVAFVKRENRRLGIDDEEDEDYDNGGGSSRSSDNDEGDNNNDDNNNDDGDVGGRQSNEE